MSESGEAMTEEQAHQHPDEIKYLKVAAILAIITAAEVGIIYVTAWENMFRQMLAILMVIKFAMVAMYFMHLKFDSRVFRRFFILGIILAIAVYGIVLWTFTVVDRPPGA
jgi:cytochrome c oxidase subunit 4